MFRGRGASHEATHNLLRSMDLLSLRLYKAEAEIDELQYYLDLEKAQNRVLTALCREVHGDDPEKYTRGER